MREKLVKLIVFLSSALFIIYILLLKNTADPVWAVALALSVNIVSTPVYFFIIGGLFNLNRFGLWWKTKVLFRNKEVRLSISYLFRIKVNGEYLLVANRTKNYYQLVGGAYKTLPGVKKIFNRYKVKPDRRFETENGVAKNDLRFTVPGKNVLKMIDWFHSKEDREISQWREFCEELLTTGLLDKHIFRYIDYTYACTVQTPMKKAKNLDCQEILIFEIFDLVPNDKQKQELEKLKALGNTDEVKWANPLLVNTLGFDELNKVQRFDIGAHTKWAIVEKWTDD